MEREYIDSTMITSVGYDSSSCILEIEFKSSGAVWQYFDFPESLWHEFRSAESLGSFWHKEIKNKFTESRVG